MNATFEDILGTMSRLAEPLVLNDGWGNTWHMQLATAVIALLYLAVVVTYSDGAGYLLRQTLGLSHKRSEAVSLTSELRNIELGMATLGILGVTLFVVRYAHDYGGLLYGIRYGDVALGTITCAMLVTLIIGECILLCLVGWICQCYTMCSMLIHLKLQHLATTIILLLPPLMLYLVGSRSIATIGLWAIFLICIIAFSLFIKETFLFFRHQRVSIFHWFLYLCTLEFIPLTLLVAPIVRGS